MLKKFICISFLIFFSVVLISCKKNTSSVDIQNVKSSDTLEPTIAPTETPDKNTDFKVIYQGFILVDEDKVSDYYMTNYYMITSEEDWETWNSKYTSKYPYYLNDLGMNWDKECLVVYAYYGAKDFWNTISPIKDVSFTNNIVNITYNEDETPIYAFNGAQKNIALFVVKVNKPSNLKVIEPRFFKYETYEQMNSVIK